MRVCVFKKAETHTHPGTHFALPEPALLPDLVGPAELLHVLTEVTLGAVFGPHAGLTLPAHACRALNLQTYRIKHITCLQKGSESNRPHRGVSSLLPVSRVDDHS